MRFWKASPLAWPSSPSRHLSIRCTTDFHLVASFRHHVTNALADKVTRHSHASCRFCNVPSSVETSFHLVVQCPLFHSPRMIFWNSTGQPTPLHPASLWGEVITSASQSGPGLFFLHSISKVFKTVTSSPIVPSTTRYFHPNPTAALHGLKSTAKWLEAALTRQS